MAQVVRSPSWTPGRSLLQNVLQELSLNVPEELLREREETPSESGSASGSPVAQSQALADLEEQVARHDFDIYVDPENRPE